MEEPLIGTWNRGRGLVLGPLCAKSMWALPRFVGGGVYKDFDILNLAQGQAPFVYNKYESNWRHC